MLNHIGRASITTRKTQQTIPSNMDSHYFLAMHQGKYSTVSSWYTDGAAVFSQYDTVNLLPTRLVRRVVLRAFD
jgi:hypothetical protein